MAPQHFIFVRDVFYETEMQHVTLDAPYQPKSSAVKWQAIFQLLIIRQQHFKQSFSHGRWWINSFFKASLYSLLNKLKALMPQVDCLYVQYDIVIHQLSNKHMKWSIKLNSAYILKFTIYGFIHIVFWLTYTSPVNKADSIWQKLYSEVRWLAGPPSSLEIIFWQFHDSVFIKKQQDTYSILHGRAIQSCSSLQIV